MRHLEKLFLTLILALIPALVYADCGKIIILTCPPGTDPSKLGGMSGTGASTNGSATDGKTDTKPSQGSTDQKPDGSGQGGATNGGQQPPEPTNTNQASGGTDEESFAKKVTRVAKKRVFKEPNQVGVLAFNGSKEILVLNTNEMSTVGKAAMISFLPLPGKCTGIREGDRRLFDRAAALIAAKLDAAQSKNPYMTKKIGAHNIFVWESSTFADFANKVQKYLRAKYKGKAIAVFTKDTERVLKGYFSRGFRHIAVDLVMVDSKKSTKVAIEYEFESKYLYFPLVVSQSGGTGDTVIDLIVITKPNGLGKNAGIASAKIDVIGGKSVTFTAKDLQGLHKGMAALFGNTSTQARHWRVKGKLDNFDKDIVVYAKK